MNVFWAALVAASPAVVLMTSLAFLGWRAGRVDRRLARWDARDDRRGL